MKDITISNNRAEFISSVLGSVNEQIEKAEVVDETHLHLHLSNCVMLISVQQYSFNGQTFSDSLNAVDYISNL